MEFEPDSKLCVKNLIGALGDEVQGRIAVRLVPWRQCSRGLTALILHRRDAGCGRYLDIERLSPRGIGWNHPRSRE